MLVGTFLYAWWTARATYKWGYDVVPAEASSSTVVTAAHAEGTSTTTTALIFGDLDGDGRDDLVQTVGDQWFVAPSNGVDGWGNASLWWCDQQPTRAERFLLPGSAAAAAVYSESSASGHAQWTVAMNGRNHASAAAVGCDGSVQRSVSAGSLWCLGGDDRTSSWLRYDLQLQNHWSQRLKLPPGSDSEIVQLFVGEVTNDSHVDAVVLDSRGNVYVGVGAASNGSQLFEELRLVFSGFFAFKVRLHPPPVTTCDSLEPPATSRMYYHHVLIAFLRNIS